MPDAEQENQCGFVREKWDGPYRLRDRCTAPSGHTDSRLADNHGPWKMVKED